MNHAKVTIIDNKEAIIGSNNIDILSFDLNTEVGVFLKDSVVVDNLGHIVDIWKKDSVLFNFNRYKTKWFDYVISPLMSIFYRIF